MKQTAVFLLMVTVFLVATAVLAQSGGIYDISWNTYDGGSGESTGGIYDLAGSIGQPDAGTLSGGIYTLQGGFWNNAVAFDGSTATATLTNTPTHTPTATATPTNTPTNTPIPMHTATPTLTATPTVVPLANNIYIYLPMVARLDSP